MNSIKEILPVEVKDEFVNTIKLLLYKNSSKILEKIDFDNEDIYLNSILFSYFNSKKDNLFPKDILEEILQGYFIKKEKVKAKFSFNKNEISYIPNLGYFMRDEDKPYEAILTRGDFEVIKEVHPTIEKYFIEYYKGHIVNQNPKHNSVWKDYYEELFDAIEIIKQHLPDFYKELVFANNKVYLHDNPKILNFTSVETLGMLYFYVIEGNNLIYFIEELIHQGSHNYLYYILHNRKEYFKIDVDNLAMRDFTKQQWDYRTIYGAFHGLFTVTQRVVCFDELVTENTFYGREKHELLGRLADQFSRFRTGLEMLEFNEVYTEKGIAFYNELDTKCKSILNKYSKLENVFDLSNRDLDFRYDDFCKLNPFEDFSKMDKSGVFDF